MRLAHTPYGLIRRWPSFFRARRAGIKRPVARATGGDRREFLSFEPRGLAAPAVVMPPLRGWLPGYAEGIADRIGFPSPRKRGEGSSDDDYMQSSRITAK